MHNESPACRRGRCIMFYGVIGTSEQRDFGSIGIEGKQVYTVVHRDIAAIVSDSPPLAFDSLPKETILYYLAAYQVVIEEVMKGYHVIPMKFGTVVNNEEIKNILEKGYSRIDKSLQNMQGKMELDVVALWSNLDSILKEMGEEEEIKRFKEEAAIKPPDQIYQAKINLGKMVKASLDKRRNKVASEILNTLKGEAKDLRPHDLMDDFMIMNTAFLIDKDKEEEFDRKVNRLDKKHQDKINFRIVGPLPPYSFCTLEIKKIDFEEVDEARKTLGLGEEATLFQIKEGYRKLGKEFHPDKHPGNPQIQKRFENITKAYQILGDYCQGDRCSFKEVDVRDFVRVEVLETPSAVPTK